ncbi:meiosis regulator and mRNA stability factor 1 isoform X1 [Agrilus planipennis]|uniref:Meiosis regulator and mRNA stability factor 1 n=1 Tax=Agrilus planipennis TaxID=224129 RepID=A0A7F5RKE3_AGRPL|nr:meiosis regulator and mRNA stability factor 1 isoform X1 [Agrilus planipennis]
MYSSSLDSKKSSSTSDDGNSRDTETAFAFASFHEKGFVFPRAPSEPPLCRSITNSSCSRSEQSDASVSDGLFVKTRKRNKRKSQKSLVPIGVFWDIENCQVPKNKSASSVVQRIRELFFSNYREAEFIVVCDVKKESSQIVQELNDSQVNLIHVSSTSKNAADEKLRQSLRRFAEIYRAPAAVALISSDVNFAADLSDLRYRKKMHVILIHNTNVADALILCANETYSFSVITGNLPEHKTKICPVQPVDLFVTNLPLNCDIGKIKNRLHFLCNNCGGRVVNLNKLGQATIRFSSLDFAKRAQRRMQGEDVFGNKINVSNPTAARESPFKSYTGRRVKSSEASAVYQISNYTSSQPNITTAEDIPSYRTQQTVTESNTWKSEDSSQELSTVAQFLTPRQPPQAFFRPIRGLGLMETSSLEPRKSLERRCQTPQGAIMAGAGSLSFQEQQQDDLNKSGNGHSLNLMRSISSSNITNQGGAQSQCVDLIITNLDPAIEIKELRKILINMLKQFVMVMNLSITSQADGSPVATVRVSSQQEAQFAISQLHRQKLGHRRITIMYAQTSGPDISKLRTFVMSLLKEVPGNRMPLFKFVSLLETRYRTNVSVSDLYKLREICRITDTQGGRMIMLLPEMRNSPTPKLNEELTMYCCIHCPNGLEKRGWGEADLIELPNVKVSLKMFSSKIYTLLTTHSGILPLLSLQICYETELSEPLPTDESGVPLEHLVTCVKNVELKYGGPNKNIKYLQLKTETNEIDAEDSVMKYVSPSLIPNISLLCRELIDLLKTYDRCQLPLNKFIPAYHHHFGRQCRVADYGFIKLADLFEVLSHVVQILGEGASRMLTLSHIAQTRRFTTDLLRVLKGQQSKQVTLCDFPSAYEKTLNKPFNPVEYGLCMLEDLLSEVPDNTVVYNRVNGQMIISIPKRDQTPEEVARTKQFASEVVELLKHAPNCSMLFNKFVPAYHHHFGHQCKVSDYGFTKLIELFEAIPDTVKVEELPSGERKISLLLPLAMKVLESQIIDLLKNSQMPSMSLNAVNTAFLKEYGYPLKPQAYECNDINELISRFNEKIEVVNSNSAGPLLLMRQENNKMLEIRVWSLLLNPPHCLKISAFIQGYRVRFHSTLSMSKLEQLNSIVKLSSDSNETMVTLTPLYVLAAQIYHILQENKGLIPLNNLSGLYAKKYGRPLKCTDYNFHSMEGLLNELNFVAVLRKSRRKCSLVLNKELAVYGLDVMPSFHQDQTKDAKGKGNFTNWPPPPLPHDLLNNTKSLTPPKPDTPNMDDHASWSSVWETPTKPTHDFNLSIPMPPFQTPKLLTDPNDLISPTRSLLSANRYPLGSVIPLIAAPHPRQLPMPNKLIENSCYEDELNDSGVNTFSHLEMECKDVPSMDH